MTPIDPRVKLALDLFRCGAFKDKTHATAVVRDSGERGFKIKRHKKKPKDPLSPFYLMLRTPDNPKPGPLTKELVAACGAQLVAKAREEDLRFLHVVGLPNAGDPFADSFLKVSQSNATTQLHLRKEIVGGKRKIVGPPQGNYRRGGKVLVIDDLITGADTKLEGITGLEEVGLVVRDVLVLVDRSSRQQGGAQILSESGYKLHAVFSSTELLDIYLDHSCISEALHREIQAYIAA